LKRFIEDRRLKGHNAGNLLLTCFRAMPKFSGRSPGPGGDPGRARADSAGDHRPGTLVAELTDGTRIFGEKAIDVPRGTQREKIRDVFLVPTTANPYRFIPR